MRPCHSCGTPVANSETYCQGCEEEKVLPESEKPHLESNEFKKTSEMTFVLVRLFQFSLGALIFGSLIGATVFGLCFGMLKLSLNTTIFIAIVVGMISAATLLFGQISSG